jgi:single-strand DNA-binding protein
MADTGVQIVGNLADDPELRYTPNDTAVASFRVAVTPRVREGDTWRDGETSYFRCNAWRALGEHVAWSLTKGDRVVVMGRLRQRSWETPEGDKRSVVEIEVDEVGPSLRWAIAKPQRTNPSADAARRTAEAATGGQPRTAPARLPRIEPSQFDDEPPF